MVILIERSLLHSTRVLQVVPLLQVVLHERCITVPVLPSSPFDVAFSIFPTPHYIFLDPYCTVLHCTCLLTPNLYHPLPVARPTFLLPCPPGQSHPKFYPPYSTHLPPPVRLSSCNISTNLHPLFSAALQKSNHRPHFFINSYRSFLRAVDLSQKTVRQLV